MTMSLTLPILQALLSPDSSIRSQAETAYQSIAIPERISALINHLLTLSSSSSSSSNYETSTAAALTMLTAVLLRRDILKLTDPGMLNDLVDPLLQCYNSNNSNSSSNSRLQIGHCLAEICCSLSILSSTNESTNSSSTSAASAAAAVPVLAKVVAALQNPTHDSSLKLLSSLADRAPVSFSQVVLPSSLSSLVAQWHLTNFSTGSSSSSTCTLETVTQLVVNAAIASTIPSVSLVREAPPNLDELSIDANSTAATLGEGCLLPIYSAIIARQQQQGRTDDVDVDDSSQTMVVECLQALSQAAVTCPSLLAGKSNVLAATVELCLGLAHQYTTTTTATATADDPPSAAAAAVALAALQVLTSLVSVAAVRHGVLTQAMAQQVAQQAIPVCAQLMAQGRQEVDAVQEWAADPATLVEGGMDTTNDNGDCDDDDDNAMFAESQMDALLQYLAGPALNVAMSLVQQLLQSTDNWRNVRAGLAILETGLMAAPVSLASHVPEIVKAATSFATESSNENPRIQYQAVRLLGALCETHPSVRELYGQVMLAPLANALGSPVSKVSAMASLSLVSYCRGSSASGQGDDELDASQFLVPYLSDLMQALLKPLSITDLDPGSVTVRVRAMNAVACLAQASGNDFDPFYSQIKTGLLASIQIPQVDIATASLQSLTIVGQAVGKDLFHEDAVTVLSWIIPFVPQSTSAVPSSPFAMDDLLTACARIASVLEENFAPYIEKFLPALYAQAASPIDVSVEDGDESGMQSAGVSDDTESMTVALPGQGFQRISINTTAIQEKAANNRVMYELAKSLGVTFYPYAQKALEVFSPLTKFKYSADVRSTASQTLSALFATVCAYGEQSGDATIARHFFPLLADAVSAQISQEDPSDVESLYASADSLSEIFYIVFENGMKETILSVITMHQVEEIVSRCMQTMASCLERRKSVTQILEGALTGEDEKEAYLAQLRAEDGLMTPLVDSTGYLLKFTKASFVPLFDKYVVSMLGQYLDSTADVRASIASMLLFDDCVEYCGQPAAAKYSPLLVQGVLPVMQEPSKYDRELVQAAVYGIAQMARYAPSTVLAPHLQTIVHQLLALSQGSKEDAGDSLYLHDISVSALASMTLFGPFTNLKFLNRDTVVDIFLNNLPIEENFDEAKICHAGLCTLIESGSINPVTDALRMTRIIGAILSDVQQEGLDVATPDTCERLTKILYETQQQNPQAVLQAYSSLSGEAQEALTVAMQDFSQSRSNLITP